MRILFLGDVVGISGCSKLTSNLLNEIDRKKIDFVIVGPEEPLVKGIVDFLIAKNIKVFGPDKFSSQLEGSKAFMKNLCKKIIFPLPILEFSKSWMKQ